MGSKSSTSPPGEDLDNDVYLASQLFRHATTRTHDAACLRVWSRLRYSVEQLTHELGLYRPLPESAPTATAKATVSDPTSIGDIQNPVHWPFVTHTLGAGPCLPLAEVVDKITHNEYDAHIAQLLLRRMALRATATAPDNDYDDDENVRRRLLAPPGQGFPLASSLPSPPSGYLPTSMSLSLFSSTSSSTSTSSSSSSSSSSLQPFMTSLSPHFVSAGNLCFGFGVGVLPPSTNLLGQWAVYTVDSARRTTMVWSALPDTVRLRMIDNRIKTTCGVQCQGSDMQHKVLPGLEGRDGGPIALAFAEQLLSGQDVRSLDTAFPINAASARVRHSRLMAADIDVATAILDRIAMNPSLADRVLELRRAGLKAAAGRKEEGRREHEARKAVAEKRKRNNDSATSKTNNSGRYDHRDGRVDGRQHGGGNARRMERETPYSRRPPCNTAQWSTSMRRPVGM